MPIQIEHENENALRNYPFAESSVMEDTNGMPLSSDIFIDAVLHPIVNEPNAVKLDSIDFARGGVVTVSCGERIMSGKAKQDDTILNLYDSHGRRAGTIGLGDGWKREYETYSIRQFSDMLFCSAVSCPVLYDGVEGFVLPSGEETTRKNVILRGDSCLLPIIDSTISGVTLSFDAVFDQVDEEQGENKNKSVIRQIIFATIGRSVFSLYSESDSTILVTTPPFDREDVCWQAHREDSVTTIVDTCKNQEKCRRIEIEPKRYQYEVCPSDIGSISILSYDLPGFKNPLKIDTVQGMTVVPTYDNSENKTIDDVFNLGLKLSERPAVVGRGIEISIPGLNNVE